MNNNNEKTPDYPAAHSMDTEWFAIDADGNIGLFDSGEEGAVPVSCKLRDMSTCGLDFFLKKWQRLSEDKIIRLPLQATLIIEYLKLEKYWENDLNILLASQSLAWKKEVEAYEFKVHDKHWFIFPKKAERIEDIERHYSSKYQDYNINNNDYDQDSYLFSFLGEPHLLLITHCPAKIIQHFIAEDYLSFAKSLDAIRKEILLGLFEYSFSDYEFRYYERNSQPICPIKIENLPQELQYWMQNTCFQSLKFPDTKILQPIEHMECNTWWNDDGSWIDIQGNEHDKHPEYEKEEKT